MILAAVAFVLAAAVLLGVGVVVDAGAIFIWASIGACLMAFAVLGLRAGVRRRDRRDQDTGAAAAASAADGTDDAADAADAADDALPLAPRRRVRPAVDAVPAGFAPVDLEDDDEPTVTILHADGAREAPSEVATPTRASDRAAPPRAASFLDEPSDEPTVTIFPGGRARAAAAGVEEPTAVAAPAPTPDDGEVRDEGEGSDGGDAAAGTGERAETAVATDAGPSAPAPAAGRRRAARRVVRPRDASTRTVVQLVVTADGSIGRRVVRRSSADTPRTVRRVVRRAVDADAAED